MDLLDLCGSAADFVLGDGRLALIANRSVSKEWTSWNERYYDQT